MEKTWALLHRRFDPIACASFGCPLGPPMREVSARNCVCAIICVTDPPPDAPPAPPLAEAAAAPVVVPAAAAAAPAVAATAEEATAEAMETATAEPTTRLSRVAVTSASCSVSPTVSFWPSACAGAGGLGRGMPRKVPLETLL
eukprot:3469729-Rhodomonas_salina.1